VELSSRSQSLSATRCPQWGSSPLPLPAQQQAKRQHNMQVSEAEQHCSWYGCASLCRPPGVHNGAAALSHHLHMSNQTEREQQQQKRRGVNQWSDHGAASLCLPPGVYDTGQQPSPTTCAAACITTTECAGELSSTALLMVQLCQSLCATKCPQ
jgi:hypothetical protein